MLIKLNGLWAACYLIQGVIKTRNAGAKLVFNGFQQLF